MQHNDVELHCWPKAIRGCRDPFCSVDDWTDAILRARFELAMFLLKPAHC
jgi:hypothetical protein